MTTTTIFYLTLILNCIALVGYAWLIYDYYRLSHKYKELSLGYCNLFEEYKNLLFDSRFVDSEVFVAEEHNYFVVGREGRHGLTIISAIEYNPNDPDDKEYKRIHAEEIAEILNEKP